MHANHEYLASMQSSFSMSKSRAVCNGEMGSPSNENDSLDTATSSSLAKASIAFFRGSVYSNNTTFSLEIA